MSPTELDCGCRFPGGPYCDRFHELLRAKARAKKELWDAEDEFEEARDQYGRAEAKDRLRRARTEYEGLRRAFRDHRSGPEPEIPDIQRPRRG